MAYTERAYPWQAMEKEVLEQLLGNERAVRMGLQRVSIAPFRDFEGEPALDIRLYFPAAGMQPQDLYDRMWLESYASLLVRGKVGLDYGFMAPKSVAEEADHA